MERSRNRVQARANYVMGSAAPAHHVKTDYKKKKIKRRKAEPKTVYITSLDVPYLMVLLIASFVSLMLLYQTIKTQSSILERTAAISSMQQKYENLKHENDQLEASLNTPVNLDEVYEIATKELGMKYPDSDQTIKFTKTERGYVRQYENLPK